MTVNVKGLARALDVWTLTIDRITDMYESRFLQVSGTFEEVTQQSRRILLSLHEMREKKGYPNPTPPHDWTFHVSLNSSKNPRYDEVTYRAWVEPGVPDPL